MSTTRTRTTVFRTDASQSVEAGRQVKQTWDKSAETMELAARRTEALAAAELKAAQNARLLAGAQTEAGKALAAEDLERAARAAGDDSKANELAARALGHRRREEELTKKAALATAGATRKDAEATRLLAKETRLAAQAQGFFNTKLGKGFQSLGRWAKGVGVAALAVLGITTATATVAGAVEHSLGSYMGIETGLIGVAKTADLTDEELGLLQEQIERLSLTDVPLEPTKLLEIAQAAGQLGVKGIPELTLFTETIGKLDAATDDLRGAEAAMELQRILTVSGESSLEVKNLASVMVHLGNNMAVTEGQVAHFTNEVARNVAVFQISSQEPAAWAAAFAASGARAESAGSVIGRTAREIQMAVSAGGEDLRRFAEIAELETAEFARLWREDANAGLVAFVHGLGRYGADVGTVLSEVGLNGARVNSVLAPLAANFEHLAKAQDLATKDGERLLALDREAERAFGSTANQVQRLKNAVTILGAQIGEQLVPLVAEGSEALIDFIIQNRDLVDLLNTGVPASMVVLKVLFAELNEDVLQLRASGVATVAVFGAVVNASLTTIEAIATMGARLPGIVGATAQAALLPVIGEIEGARETLAKTSADLVKILSPENNESKDDRFAKLLADAKGFFAALHEGSKGGAEDLEDFERSIHGAEKAFEEYREAALRQAGVVDLMIATGLSAEEAAEAVRILQSQDNTATTQQVVDLVRHMSELKNHAEEVADLMERISAAETWLAVESVNPPELPDSSSVQLDPIPDGLFSDMGVEWLETNGYIQVVWEETNGELVQHVKVLRDEHGRAASEISDAWLEAGFQIADVLSGIDEGLGQLAGTLAQVAVAARNMAAARKAGDAQALSAAKEDLAGSIIGSAGSYLGSALAGGGTTAFGGQRSGTFSSEGQQIGAIFGPWASAAGALVGSLFKKGGDVAQIILEDSEAAGAAAEARIVKATGGLQEIAGNISDALTSFMSGVQELTGASLSAAAADLSVEVEDDVITVRVRGLVQGFRTLDEALAWAGEQVLAANDSVDGLSENVRRLFEGLGGPDATGSFDELQRAVDLATRADRLRSGPVGASPEFEAALDEIARLRTQEIQEMDLARRYGLVLSDVLALTEQRLALARQEVEVSRANLLGITDRLSGVKAVVGAMAAYNAGLGEERAAREKQLEDLYAEREALVAVGSSMTEAAAAAGAAAGEAAAGFRGLREGGRGLREDISSMAGDWGQPFETARDASVEATRGALEHARAVERTQEEIDALEASLDDFGAAFDAQEIADAWTAAASGLGQDLISMIRRVKGEEYGAAEERLFQAEQYKLALVGQIAQTYTFLELASSISPVLREALLTLVEDAQALLADGDFSFDAPRRASGTTGNRRQRREDLREELALLESGVDALGGVVSEIHRIQTETAQWVAEARQLGQITSEEIARYQELQGAREQSAADDAVLGTLENLARAAGDEELLAELQRQRQVLEIESQVAQIAWLHEMGLVSDEVYSRVQSLADDVVAGLDGLAPGAVDQAISSLGLTLEGTRKQFEGLREQLDVVRQAAEEGAISQARYAEITSQAATEMALNVGGGLLAFADRYFADDERFEEQRAALMELRYDYELAQLQLMLTLAQELELLTEEQVARAQEAIGIFQAERPDFSAGGGASASDPFAALPLDRTRERIDELSTALDEVHQYLLENIEDQREYRNVLEETQGSLTLDFGDRLVRFTERYFGDTEKGQEILLRMEILRFEIGRRQLQVEIELLLEKGLLLESEADLLREQVAWIQENTPDFDSLVAGGTGPSTVARGGFAAADAAQGLRDLGDAVRDLVDSWQGDRLGQLAQEASDFVSSYEDMAAEILDAIPEGSYYRELLGRPREELEAIYAEVLPTLTDEAKAMWQAVFAALDLDEAYAEEAPKRIEEILAQANGSTLPEYQQRMLEIHRQYEDMRAALEALGATSEQVTSTYEGEQAALEAYMDSLTGRAQDLLDRLQFDIAGGSGADRIHDQIAELQSLRAAIRGGDLSQIDAAVDLAAAIEGSLGNVFSGSLGASRGIRELLAEAMGEIVSLTPEDVVDFDSSMLDLGEQSLAIEEEQLEVMKLMEETLRRPGDGAAAPTIPIFIPQTSQTFVPPAPAPPTPPAPSSDPKLREAITNLERRLAERDQQLEELTRKQEALVRTNQDMVKQLTALVFQVRRLADRSGKDKNA